MRKLLCVLLSVAVMLSVQACGPAPDNGDLGGSSSDMSILNVAVINSGLGITYAEEIEKDFEAYYKDYPFEDGKKGVDVKLYPGLDEYDSGTLLSVMHNYDTTVYILDSVNYHTLVEQDKLLDITDTMTEKVYDADGNLAEESGNVAVYSIEDLMPVGYDKFYKYKTDRYHGLPYRASIGGMIYDADLFHNSRLFFDKNGRIGANYDDIKAGNCSVGPDGVLGTTDDGLANTMKDFSALLKHMRDVGIIPFSFSGTYKYTRTEAFENIHANYEGYNDFMLNYSFNGIDSTLGKITEDNYKSLLDQDGRKAALRFFQEIASNTSNYVTTGNDGYNSLDQKQAQDKFIMSVDPIGDEKPIAFLFEGGWWESEARETFDGMAWDNEDWGYGKRNFRLYPYPNMIGEEEVPDQTNTQRLILGHHEGQGCSVFLSKVSKAENQEVANEIGKKFLQFINKRDQLIKFTKNTGGCVRCIEVPTPYTKEEIATLTKYGQSIYEFINEGAVLAYTCPTAEKRLSSPRGFGSGDGGWGFWAEPAGGMVTNCPIHAYRITANSNGGKVVSVANMFSIMKSKILYSAAP